MRPACLTDIEWMAECHWNAYREHTTEEFLSTDYSDYVQMASFDILTRKVYVDEELRCYVVVDMGSTTLLKDEYNCAFIKRIYVKPKFRGQGLYHTMTDYVKEKLNCVIMQILTDEEYKEHGGNKIGVVCTL